MKSEELLLAMRDFLQKSLEHVLFPTQDDETISPHVFVHDLPHRQERKGLFPFVIIRFDDGETTEELCEDSLVLALGVYAEEGAEEAGLMLAKLTDHIRTAFYKQRLIGVYDETDVWHPKFDLVLPIKVEQVSPKQKWNEFHLSSLLTTWRYNVPPRELANDI